MSYTDANLREELERLEQKYGEPIEGMVIGAFNDRYSPLLTDARDDKAGVLLNRWEGLAVLDYDYYSGHGGADCHPFHAWTKSRVFFVHEYDGATQIVWVPRHPEGDYTPSFSGQRGSD